MSGLIELFWRPQPKDVPSGLIAQGRYFEGVIQTAAATATQTQDTQLCPANTLRCITHINIVALPGAAQTISRVTFNWAFSVSFQSTFQYHIQPPVGFPAATEFRDARSLADGIWLRPGELIRVVVAFNAGVANNQFSAGVWGYEFPVGNTL